MYYIARGFPGGFAVKNPPEIQELQDMQVRSLSQEDPLEEGMATHFSILAWRIPWTEELVGYSPWDHKGLDTTEATEHAHINASCSGWWDVTYYYT